LFYAHTTTMKILWLVCSVWFSVCFLGFTEAIKLQAPHAKTTKLEEAEATSEDQTRQILLDLFYSTNGELPTHPFYSSLSVF